VQDQTRMNVNYLQIRFIYRHLVTAAPVKCASRIVATPATQTMIVAPLRHPYTANRAPGQTPRCIGRRYYKIGRIPMIVYRIPEGVLCSYLTLFATCTMDTVSLSRGLSSRAWR